MYSFQVPVLDRDADNPSFMNIFAPTELSAQPYQPAIGLLVFSLYSTILLFSNLVLAQIMILSVPTRQIHHDRP